MSSSAVVATVLAAVVLVAGTLALTVYLMRRQQATLAKPAAKRHLPTQWPLVPRPLANSTERQVWQWLQKVFPDHFIMVKLPVTRFTMPREAGEGEEWFDILSRAYCSFAVCSRDGHVVGCVDVVNPHGPTRHNRQLKQTLLSQCGIAYWVLEPEALPPAEALRAEFLGVPEPEPETKTETEPETPAPRDALAEVETLRSQLHEALDRNRNYRHQRTLDSSDQVDAQVTHWPQADSFLGTMDSRGSERT
ncbi:MAG: DUF2726 domain-containing protein [Pseudomonadota bacterium]|nr:DUF2726 domain-containing protein [Pseudomonadota bacterium]